MTQMVWRFLNHNHSLPPPPALQVLHAPARIRHQHRRLEARPSRQRCGLLQRPAVKLTLTARPESSDRNNSSAVADHRSDLRSGLGHDIGHYTTPQHVLRICPSPFQPQSRRCLSPKLTHAATATPRQLEMLIITRYVHSHRMWRPFPSIGRGRDSTHSPTCLSALASTAAGPEIQCKCRKGGVRATPRSLF